MATKAKSKSVAHATPAAPVAQAAAQPQQPVVRYVVVAPKRPLTGTKYNGNSGALHAKLAEACGTQGLPFAEIQAICKAAGDPGFARYALNRLRVLQEVK